MKSYWYLVAITVTVFEIHLGNAGWNENVCSELDWTCGPFPPKLPTSYILKSEVIDLNTSTTIWEEEYFDSLNLRAKLIKVKDGVESNVVFNYADDKVILYEKDRPGASVNRDPAEDNNCLTVSFAEFIKFAGNLPFGYRFHNKNSKRTRMFNVFEALRFGGNNRYQSINRTTDYSTTRYLPVNLYNGCVYDESDDGTYNMTYFFTQLEQNLTLSNGEESMPLRVEQEGSFNVHDSTPNTVSVQPVFLNKNIAWFKSNPEFDDALFQIPQDVFCSNIKPTIKWDKLPNAFSFNKETISAVYDIDGDLYPEGKQNFYKVWYNKDLLLARVDLTRAEDNSDIFNIFSSSGPYSVVMDFKENIAMISNPLTGACKVDTIPKSLFVVNSAATGGITIADPDMVFGLTDQHQYKGTYNIRGIRVDTWTANLKTNQSDAFLWHEVSFSDGGWHSETKGSEEFLIPVQELKYEDYNIINKSKDFTHTKTVSNYFRVLLEKPPESVFQSRDCSATLDKKFYQLFFPGFEKVAPYKAAFLSNIRQDILSSTTIGTVLRIQEMDMFKDKEDPNIAVVTFTLLQLLPGQTLRNNTITESAKILKAIVDSGLFVVHVASNSGQLFTVTATSMREISLVYEINQYLIQDKEVIERSYDPDQIDVAPESHSDEQCQEKTSGYSSGSFAGMAIGMLLVGMLLGSVAMVYYTKKQTERKDAEFPLT